MYSYLIGIKLQITIAIP